MAMRSQVPIHTNPYKKSDAIPLIPQIFNVPNIVTSVDAKCDICKELLRKPALNHAMPEGVSDSVLLSCCARVVHR